MSIETRQAQTRRVPTLDIATPLVVPSFSSRGFPDVATIHDAVSHNLYGVSLVSAPDVANGFLPADALIATNVVVLDSGGYETNNVYPARELCVRGNQWSMERYRKSVSDIQELANVVTVSFDRHCQLESQIEGASEDMSIAQTASFDFLIKPHSDQQLVNVAELSRHVEQLSQFPVIGVTAREIGYSFLNRCRSIVTLRTILDESQLAIPIHVFGAIRPFEILTFFLCGADIFDGLDWLRFEFRLGNDIPIDSIAWEHMQWNQPDEALKWNSWSNNLNFLYRLQGAIRGYATTGDFDDLSDEFPDAIGAARIAQLAGATTQIGG